MHTQRFKAIQIPSGTVPLLASLAASFMRDVTTARVIRTLAELPTRHRDRIGGGSDQHYLWYAWEEAGRVRLVTGALALDHSREHGRPAMEARIYDADGMLDESGTWIRSGASRWERCNW